MNILKVFEDFRQLSREDQEKIVEWYNENTLQDKYCRNTTCERSVDNGNAFPFDLPAAKKPAARILYTEAQVDFIDYVLHEGDRHCVIADKCIARWPEQHGKEAWLTKICERKAFLRKRGEL
jgi:hypothetical protein